MIYVCKMVLGETWWRPVKQAPCNPETAGNCTRAKGGNRGKKLERHECKGRKPASRVDPKGCQQCTAGKRKRSAEPGQPCNSNKVWSENPTWFGPTCRKALRARQSAQHSLPKHSSAGGWCQGQPFTTVGNQDITQKAPRTEGGGRPSTSTSLNDQGTRIESLQQHTIAPPAGAGTCGPRSQCWRAISRRSSKVTLLQARNHSEIEGRPPVKIPKWYPNVGWASKLSSANPWSSWGNTLAFSSSGCKPAARACAPNKLRNSLCRFTRFPPQGQTRAWSPNLSVTPSQSGRPSRFCKRQPKAEPNHGAK